MENINFFIVFIEGLLSIFSPCILPILPIYISMLSNSDIDSLKDSNFKSKTLVINTIAFTLGISTTFFILGSSISAMSSFFNTNKNVIMILGGVLIVIMGLFYLGIIKSDLLNREKRFNVKYKSMNPISAFILGFTFSFGWTPCIGPILASVLVMASSSDSILTANMLIGVYTIGFILPFILASLFYGKLFRKFNTIKKYMDEIKKISGIFIIIAGLIMLVNGVTHINKSGFNDNKNQNQIRNNQSVNEENKKQEEEESKILPIDFTLYDQYGNEHTLSEYKGKTVFLNFWATWCPPCRMEMPYMNELYEEYNKNQDDVVILGVASPKLGNEGDEDHIKEFLEEEGHDFPVVFDNAAEKDINYIVEMYGINAFPTTFIIDKEGYITKYIPGAMNKETMKDLIESER